MPKFNLGSESTFALTFASQSLTCVQSIDISRTAPITEIECAGATSAEQIVGIPRYTMTVVGALNDDDNALLGYIDPGDSGAIACDPAGTTTGHLDISSTNATVSDAPISMPVNGFSTYSVTFVLDDLTIAANA